MKLIFKSLKHMLKSKARTAAEQHKQEQQEKVDRAIQAMDEFLEIYKQHQ